MKTTPGLVLTGAAVLLLTGVLTHCPASAQVRSLTLGISTNCPYGGLAE